MPAFPLALLQAAQQAAADTTIALLDTTAAQAAAPVGIERVMLTGEKMPVVLAVVLIVFVGLLLYVVRTDRRLARVEAALDAAERHDATPTPGPVPTPSGSRP